MKIDIFFMVVFAVLALLGSTMTWATLHTHQPFLAGLCIGGTILCVLFLFIPASELIGKIKSNRKWHKRIQELYSTSVTMEDNND